MICSVCYFYSNRCEDIAVQILAHFPARFMLKIMHPPPIHLMVPVCTGGNQAKNVHILVKQNELMNMTNQYFVFTDFEAIWTLLQKDMNS